MTTAVLGYLKVQKSIQSKVRSINLPVINWKSVCFVGFFVSLSLLVFYVWQINNLTRGSFLVNSYETQISKLSAENKNLQVSFAENSFLGQAMEKIQALNFQKTTSVKYIQIPDSSVAIK
ncbi:MAG: hypothetical protein NTW11_01190 [Candidatus Staskawiczbacteria bacterium]|nr:hypothetical protein [Candidatus Staskawiczbacteria bacterium]